MDAPEFARMQLRNIIVSFHDRSAQCANATVLSS